MIVHEIKIFGGIFKTIFYYNVIYSKSKFWIKGGVGAVKPV